MCSKLRRAQSWGQAHNVIDFPPEVPPECQSKYQKKIPSAFWQGEEKRKLFFFFWSVFQGHMCSTWNLAFEPCLRPTPRLMATPDPQPTEQGQGSNQHPHGYESGSLPLSHIRNSKKEPFLNGQITLFFLAIPRQFHQRRTIFNLKLNLGK